MKLEVIIFKSGKWQASFCGEKSLFSWSHIEQNDTVESFCVVLFVFPLDRHPADSAIGFAAKYDKKCDFKQKYVQNTVYYLNFKTSLTFRIRTTY